MEKCSLDFGYFEVFEEVTEAFFVLDNQWHITFINKQGADLFYKNKDELIGQSIWKETPKDLADRWLFQFKKAKNEQRKNEFHEFCSEPYNKWFHFLLYPSKESLLVMIIDVTEQITQQKAVEESLRKSQQKYNSLKLHNPNGICSIDLNGQFIGVNPAFEKLTGYTFDELTAIGLQNLFDTYDYQILEMKLEMIGKFKVSVDVFELKFKNKQDQLIFTSVTLIPIFIDKQMEGFYLIVEDITSEKQKEELLIRSEKLNAVGQLAASIVHEIRNPLTSLMGFLQLMKTNEGVNHEYYQIMYDELTRINFITNELLVLAKPQEKKVKEEDIIVALEDVVKLMYSQATIHNVEINLEVVEQIPTIQCDAGQLKQVFINLIKNGLEAMEEKPSGRMNILVNKMGNKHIKISFADEGKGISSEQLDHLGEPFYTTKEKGTGLGMLMTKTIIENHQGEMVIDSVMGKGTTIHLYLPVASI